MYETDYDVVIIGAGFSGLCAAWILNQQNQGQSTGNAPSPVRILVIDRRSKYPPAFRAEKIEYNQARLLEKFGLLDARRPLASPIGEITRYRDGQYSRGSIGEQYGIRYHDTVNEIRSRVEARIPVEVMHITGISTSDDVQEITIDSEKRITCRLILLGTGGNTTIRQQFGMVPEYINELRSLSFGFDIARIDHKPFPFRGLNYFIDSRLHQIDYITLFLIGTDMRVNLFSQWHTKDHRVKSFKKQGVEMINEYFPDISKVIGEFTITSKIEVVPTTFYRLTNVKQPGVVALADDFQSVSPTTGMGLEKATNDVDILCYRYIPRWMSSSGMSADKIQQFYDDPDKRAVDRMAKSNWRDFSQSTHQNRKASRILRKLKQLFSH